MLPLEAPGKNTFILVRVLQRNRVNRVYNYIRSDYYKELAHAAVEADKPQDLQEESESWKPSRAKGVVPV